MKISTLTPAFLLRIPPVWRLRIGASLLIGTAVMLCTGVLPLRRLEWLTEDSRLQLRAKYSFVEPTGQVVLLEIDQQSLDIQGKWPFDRQIHGQVMEWLGKFPEVRPATMSWDFVFLDEDRDPLVDQAFAASLVGAGYPITMGANATQAAKGILAQGKPAKRLGLTEPLGLPPEVVNALPDMKGLLIPINPLLSVSRFALLDADPEDDSIIRKIPFVTRIGTRVFPSFVLGTLMSYWKVEPTAITVKPGESIVLHAPNGDHVIPIDREGYYHLNYRYEVADPVLKTGGIKGVSYQYAFEALVDWMTLGKSEKSLPVAGKILVVGQTANGLTDIGTSPLKSNSAKVLVHINAMENILRGDYLIRTALWPVLAGILLIGLLAAWLLDHFRTVYFFTVGGLVLALGLVSWGMLAAGNLMIPVAAPLIAFLVQQSIVTFLKIRDEQAQRDRIRKMFGSYVSPELVRRMVETRVEPKLGGHQDEITAFFSDIQGFSAFSEVLSPVDLVDLLNEYLGAMTDILQDSGGALDKYIGDAIVAMFGGLVPVATHARLACESAIKMQMRQGELRKEWTAQGDRWPALVHSMRTRIGLNSGQVVVGNMGSRHRFNFTMMGDTVNLAARCESGAKTFGAYTVATGATVEGARAAGCECVFRELDRIVVKGRTEPVVIFEIVALSPVYLSEEAFTCLELFAKGRALYLKQEWAEAKRCFDAATANEPLKPGRDMGVESNPSLIMAARCVKMAEHPPGADWDGVYRMTTK
ncbi:MAG: adenylate/guanylate cyclase domain-containing protein [Opitutus sp.]|nr:adenylate/guanylate cyclase domain-containing protein [Opitutus sp.]MCS6276506.1 adenylate/guanylate cyclase domain-containing protein [Opitutus sp.]MCS6301846.1 adenylate/guanylate cyclase domain-containing protein [Opitutus sp.]